MSAAEWLRDALEQALRIGDPARYPELVGAVEALAPPSARRRRSATRSSGRLVVATGGDAAELELPADW